MIAAHPPVFGQLFADPVLFDEGVEVARNACVAGASIAAGAMAAAAWYDNPLTGLPALRDCMGRLARAGLDLPAWLTLFAPAVHATTGDPDHTPGFGFVSRSQAARVILGCEAWARQAPVHADHTRFFLAHHEQLAHAVGPLNPCGLAALVFTDQATSIEDAERIYLLARLDPAITEAQGARRRGLGRFPFFTEQYVYEGAHPPVNTLDLGHWMREAGIDD